MKKILLLLAFILPVFVFGQGVTIRRPVIASEADTITGTISGSQVIGGISSDNADSLGGFGPLHYGDTLTNQRIGGIKTNKDDLILESSLGIGTSTPLNPLHIVADRTGSPFFSQILIQPSVGSSVPDAVVALESRQNAVTQRWFFGSGNGTPPKNNNFRIVDLTTGVLDVFNIEDITHDIGIQTTNPNFALDVNGDFRVVNLATFDAGINVNSETFIDLTGTGLQNTAGILNVNQSALNVEGFGTSLTAGSVVFSDGSNLVQDNTNFFFDNSNDRLGIGTNTPVHTLDISTPDFIVGRFTSTGGNSTRLELDHASNTGVLLSTGGTARFSLAAFETSGGSNLDYAIFNQQAGGSALIVDGNTNFIGIGGISPVSTLDVGGSLALERIATAVSDNTVSMGLAHKYVVTNTDAVRTITISSADILNTDRIFVFKDESGGAGTNNIIVKTEGVETIDGLDSLIIIADFGGIRLYSDGTNLFTSTELNTNITNRIPARQALNTVEVFVPADMPNILITGTNYIISAPITFVNGQEKTFPDAGNVRITTSNRETNSITYTGTGVFLNSTASATNRIFCNLSSTGVGATLFGINGANVTGQTFALSEVTLFGWDNLGTINNYASVNLGGSTFLGFNTGLNITNCPNVFANEGFWNTFFDTGTDFISFDANITAINFTGTAFNTKPNERNFNINSSAVVNAFFSNILLTPTEANFFNSAGLNKTSPGVIVKDSENIEDSKTLAEGTSNDNATLTTVSDGVYSAITLTNFIANGSTERFTLTDPSIGLWTYTGIPAFSGTFLAPISGLKSGATANYRFAISINGNAPTFTEITSTAISSVTDNAGTAVFNHAGTDPFVGQEIDVSGYTTNTTYNGTFNVTALAAGTFETGVAFGSNEITGSYSSDVTPYTPMEVKTSKVQVTLALPTSLITNDQIQLMVSGSGTGDDITLTDLSNTLNK